MIEGLYDLDMGITETLVERGISADFIERGGTNRDPAEVVRVIGDHRRAAEFVDDWIRDGRPLTKWFVKEMHSIICAGQDTFRAVDQFGRWFDATLNKGVFKTLPNNPTRPDGALYEYAPPEQVESQMDALVSFYNDAEARYHPLLLAAWLHHAFSTIHPFQDGNGRVDRGLLTWHLVRHEFLPVVISRDVRTEYIDALEGADKGHISDLVGLIVRLEKGTILQALGQPGDSDDSKVLAQVMDSIASRLRKRQQAALEQVKSVNAVALSLRGQASAYLEEKAREVDDSLAAVDAGVSSKVMVGGPDERTDHWYRRQILESNRDKYWVNFNENRYFARMTVEPASESRVPRLVFVVSLHHVGRQSTGQMAASAFAEIHYNPTDDPANTGGEDAPTLFKDCTLDPFTLTWRSDPEKLRSRFDKWLEESLVVALRYWAEFLEV